MPPRLRISPWLRVSGGDVLEEFFCVKNKSGGPVFEYEEWEFFHHV